MRGHYYKARVTGNVVTCLLSSLSHLCPGCCLRPIPGTLAITGCLSPSVTTVTQSQARRVPHTGGHVSATTMVLEYSLVFPFTQKCPSLVDNSYGHPPS